VHTEKQKNRKTEKQKNRKTERQKDRKTERQTDTKIFFAESCSRGPETSRKHKKSGGQKFFFFGMILIWVEFPFEPHNKTIIIDRLLDKL
jgi:hypothetical protein